MGIRKPPDGWNQNVGAGEIWIIVGMLPPMVAVSLVGTSGTESCTSAAMNGTISGFS